MFVFKKEQVTFNLGEISFGGNPGENPTILVGGLFFKGQPIVKNTREGTFDEAMALDWLNTGMTMTELTGHPLVVQVYGRTEKAIERHIAWIAENFDGPFMFESVNSKTRKRGIEFCQESGLSDRAIFNSINISMKPEEKDALKDSSLETAVVLGWSPKSTSLEERMDVIKEMVGVASLTGIKNIIVDPGTMPVGAGYGLENRTLLAIKSELGYPTCLAPHNAPSAWKFTKQSDFDDESIHNATVVASSIAGQLFTADCVMYGSMIRTREVFTSVALIGNAISSAVAEANHVLGLERDLFDPPTFQ